MKSKNTMQTTPTTAPANTNTNTEAALAPRYLSVGIAQVGCNFDPDLEKRVRTNLDTLELHAGIISYFHHPDLIVFPEVFIEGPETVRAAEVAEPIPEGPICQELMGVAKALGVWLIPGSLFEAGEDGKVYNTAIVISPEGEFVTKHRKLYPARPIEATDPGDGYCVFDIPGKGKVGLMVCYDGVFPEVARTLAWMGAEVIIKPALQTDAEGGLYASTAIWITRAVENQCYFINVNVAAPMGNGQSCIIDPEGRMIEELGRVEANTCAVLNLAEVYRVRQYGNWGGGATILKHWAYLGPKTFPCYEQGIENGEVFKTLTPTYAENPMEVQSYPK